MRALPTILRCAAVLAMAASTGCAQNPALRVYDTGELTLDRYTIVERLWTGTWRASVWVPTHDDPGSAIAAITSKAADLGADGVVNLHCVNEAGGFGSGYYCYGLAIKFR